MDAAASTRAPTLPPGDSADVIADAASTSAPTKTEESKYPSKIINSTPKIRNDTKSGSDLEYSRTLTNHSTNQEDLSRLLTIIVVTSPVMSNPSCELIERVLASLNLLGHSIERCKRVIVCDGYKLIEDNTNTPMKMRKFGCKNKKGLVTPEAKRRYEEFILNLQRRIQADNADSNVAPSSASSCRTFRHCSVLKLDSHHGFGHAVLSAVCQGLTLGTCGLGTVRTPYVLTMQHDWAFVRAFDVAALVRSMIANVETLKYVTFPTKRTGNHVQKGACKYHAKLQYQKFGQVKLYPLLSWFDRNHICSVKYYRDFVFNWKAFHGIGLKRGHFIEDNLGQKYQTDIRTHGWRKSQSEYGTWLFTVDPPVNGKEVPMLSHVDGRRYLDRAVLGEKYKVERAQRLLREQLQKKLTVSKTDRSDEDDDKDVRKPQV